MEYSLVAKSRKIVKTKNGLIWIATLGQGIFIYDPVKDVLTQNSIRTFFCLGYLPGYGFSCLCLFYAGGVIVL